MNDNQLACNYSIIRFLPYPETEEFVNVGVVLACPETQFFGVRLESTARRRIHAFFPELNKNIFTIGHKNFHKEMEGVSQRLNGCSCERVMPFALTMFNRYFLEVVKPRESVFRFSSVGTRLADDPEDALDVLYAYYVERLFAQRPKYQETEMIARLRKGFKQAQIQGYRQGMLGNDRYEVYFPFLRRNEEHNNQFKAIKPLDLDKSDPTTITNHGDAWLAKLKHLANMSYDADRVLFAVQMPENEPINVEAANEIIKQILSSGAKVSQIDEVNQISAFARTI